MGCADSVPSENSCNQHINQCTAESIQQSDNKNYIKEETNDETEKHTLLTNTINSITNVEEALSIFKTNIRDSECNITDISSCESAKRIAIVLTPFSSIQSNINDVQTQNTIIQWMDKIFIANNYTNTKLLIDFHHLKFHHEADEDDQTFLEVYSYFKNNVKTQCSSSDNKIVYLFHNDESMKEKKHYIAPKYSHLKAEMLQNTEIKVDRNRCKALQVECETHIYNWKNRAMYFFK